MAKPPITALLRFTPEAQALPSDELVISVPFHVLQGEAVDVAKFFAKYYATVPGPTKDSPPARLGLDTAVKKEKKKDKAKGPKPLEITPDTGDDILALLEATEQATRAYRLAASSPGTAPMARAKYLVDEISAALEWLFDDGVEDERDAQLAGVAKAHESTPDSADAAAAELEDYLGLGNEYRDEIDGLGGFDLATLAEGKTVVQELRNRPAAPVLPSEAAANALALRNRVATLLSNRMSLVRSAARFVFRNSPEIAREATSVYERRRRAATRRAAMKKAPAAPAAPAASPAAPPK